MGVLASAPSPVQKEDAVRCLRPLLGTSDSNFRELRKGEVRRILIPRTTVNKGKR
jgi:hypothetical protein